MKNRILLAILGLFALGGIGAILGAASAMHGATVATSTAQTTSQPQTAPQDTATAAIDGTQPAGNSTKNPTATPRAPKPTAEPTQTPQPTDTIAAPTPTKTPTSGPPPVQGTITSVDTAASEFTIRSNGNSIIVHVTATTTFTGIVNTLDGERTGYRVSVQGTSDGNGSMVATAVYTSNPDN